MTLHRSAHLPFDTFLDPEDTASGDVTVENEGPSREDMLLEGVFDEEGLAEDEPPTNQQLESAQVDEADEADSEEIEESRPSLIQRLGELGFQDLADEEEATARIIEAYQAERQRAEERDRALMAAQPLIQYGNQYLAQQSRGQDEAPAPKQEATDEPWWAPPQYDHTVVEKYRERDPETGEGRWKEGTPDSVRESAEAYQAYIDKWATDLTTRPNEVLAPAIRAVVREELGNFRQESEREQSQKREQEFWGSIQTDNPWLFRMDPVSKSPMVDPHSGEKILSDAGARIAQHMESLKGIEDPRTVWNYAVKAYQAETNEAASSTTDAEQQATATAEQRRQEHLRRAAQHVPDRSGSLNNKTGDDDNASQNRHLRPGQKLVAQAAAEGVSLWNEG